MRFPSLTIRMCNPQVEVFQHVQGCACGLEGARIVWDPIYTWVLPALSQREPNSRVTVRPRVPGLVRSFRVGSFGVRLRAFGVLLGKR